MQGIGSARRSLAAGAALIMASATTVLAVVSTFQTGEFYTTEGAVTRGVFGGDVWIKNCTMGQRTLTTIDGGLGNASAVRVYAAPPGSDDFALVPDDAIGQPGVPVGFAIGRDLDPASVRTALEAASGFSLSRMLFTHGTDRVRIDMLAAAPQRDNDPDNDDPEPEAIVVGSLKGLNYSITPIIGGEVDAPVLGNPVRIPDARAAEGETGISILLHGEERPVPISMVGLDLSGDFVLPGEQKLFGYRIEIEPGTSAMIKGWFTGIGADVMPSEFDDEAFKQVLAGVIRDGSQDNGVATGAGLPTGYNPGLFEYPGGFSGEDGSSVRAPPSFSNSSPPSNGGGGSGGGGSGGGGGGNGGGPSPPIPAPGVISLLAIALGLTQSRRRR